jgi:hypothetical protein
MRLDQTLFDRIKNELLNAKLPIVELKVTTEERAYLLDNKAILQESLSKETSVSFLFEFVDDSVFLNYIGW